MSESTPAIRSARFDELFDEAEPAILGGRHVCDVVPGEGGRWPISAVLLPSPPQGAPLSQVTQQLLPLVGPDHLLSGHPLALHVTVRALEFRREHVGLDDPTVGRYLAAIKRAARRSAPVRLQGIGLTLTVGGVMAALQPLGETADQLAAALGEELGDDGWHEADLQRTIWYSTLVHFTAPIAAPSGLVKFVADRRQMDLGRLAIDRLSLVGYDHTIERTGISYMRCRELGAERLGSGPWDDRT